MSTLESWVEIPPYAAPIVDENEESTISQTILSPPSQPDVNPSSAQVTSDAKDSGPAKVPSGSSITGNLTHAVLSAALNVPSSATPSDPRKTASRLLSTRDSLSIPITTVNFRRFVSKTGAVFWLQDRIEEIIFWRKGWKVTTAWIVGYSFICYYPRLVLLLPHVFLLSILFITYNVKYPPDAAEDSPPNTAWRPVEAREGSSEWFANLQAIQNLMGFYADCYDEVVPLLPHISHSTPTSAPLLTFLIVSFLVILPLLPLLPLRPTFFIIGVTPLIMTHPMTQRILPALLSAGRNAYLTTFQRIIDNDRLEDDVWASPMKEVELWENERWSLAANTSTGSKDKYSNWSKAHLKNGERKGWTRRRDGWSGDHDLGGNTETDISSNLTFTLEPGWEFVKTEDWRVDITGSWASHVSADENGWVYSNDVWNELRAEPPEEWKLRGMTRRRRWIRRIYHSTPKRTT